MLRLRSLPIAFGMVAALGLAAVAGARGTKPDVRPSGDCADVKPASPKAAKSKPVVPCKDTSARTKNVIVVSIDGDSVLPDSVVTIFRVKPGKTKKA